MIKQLREMGLLWSGLVVIVAFGILIALGNWQWQRMSWKEGLLRQLQQATKAKPVGMSFLSSRALTANDLQALRFRRLTVEGVFEHDREKHVWAPTRAGPSWSVITPFRLNRAAARDTGTNRHISEIFVIRGIVPSARKSPAKRLSGQIRGMISITGRVRLDQPNRWANAPDMARNEWFTRDLEAMVDSRIIEHPAVGPVVAPFFLEAENQMGGSTAPKPLLKALKLSNRHLEYALTWWGLAATLLGVFAVFAWGRINSAKS